MYLSPKGSVSAYSIIFVEPALKLDVTHFCPSRPTCTSRGCDLGGRDFRNRNSGRGRLRVAWCALSIEGSRTCPSTKISTLKLSAFCAMTAVGRRPRAPTVTRSEGATERKGCLIFPDSNNQLTHNHVRTRRRSACQPVHVQTRDGDSGDSLRVLHVLGAVRPGRRRTRNVSVRVGEAIGRGCRATRGFHEQRLEGHRELFEQID